MSQKIEYPLTGTSDKASHLNALMALIRSMLTERWHTMPVQVIEVTNDGGVSPIGYVDVLPLIQQVDGSGNTLSHAPIYNVPYMRLQGGVDAVILDPRVGDIGFASFCDRDISALKVAKKESPPGSGRHNDLADAIYLSSIIAPAPQQYVRFSEEGIEMVSPISVRIHAPSATIDSETTINGSLAVNGGSITNDGVPVDKTHFHDKVQPGSGNSGTPVAP